MKRPSLFTVTIGLVFNFSISVSIMPTYLTLLELYPSIKWIFIAVFLFISNMLILYWCVFTDIAIEKHLKKEEEEKLREEIEKSIRKELEEEFRKKTE